MNRLAPIAALLVTTALSLPATAAAHNDRAASRSRTVFAASPHLNPSTPVGAPDGSVWFARDGEGVSRLARIAPGGKLTEFAVPPPANDLISGLSIAAVAPDGRVWFHRDGDTRIGVLDPSSGVARIQDVRMNAEALTVTRDGTVWVAGDSVVDFERAVLLRIGLSGSRRRQNLGASAIGYRLAPAQQPGAVIAVRDDVGGRRLAEQIEADGDVRAITLPRAGDDAASTVASGPGGSFIAAYGGLLRLDGDLVARRVAGVRTNLDNPGQELAAGGDGSLWQIAGAAPVVRHVPGSSPRRYPLPPPDHRNGSLAATGVTVARNGDAWVTTYFGGERAAKRERLLRITPSGRVSEYVLGVPPTASATVLRGSNADSAAVALARGREKRLRVRVRCSAACSVRLTVRDARMSATSTYARRSVRLERAGSTVVTLRATRSAGADWAGKDLHLVADLVDRSGYIRQAPGGRSRAGEIIPVR